jgi:hypothetical protein
MLEPLLDRLEHRGPPAADELGPGARDPCLGERSVVSDTREDGPRLLG